MGLIQLLHIPASYHLHFKEVLTQPWSLRTQSEVTQLQLPSLVAVLCPLASQHGEGKSRRASLGSRGEQQVCWASLSQGCPSTRAQGTQHGPQFLSLCRALSPMPGSGPGKASPSSSDGERREEESQERDRDTSMPSVPMGQAQSSKPVSPDLFQLTTVNFVLEYFHQKFMKHLPCGRPWGNQITWGKKYSSPETSTRNKLGNRQQVMLNLLAPSEESPAVLMLTLYLT